jgi:hypothetical protein
METKYYKISISSNNFFHNLQLQKHIKKNYVYFYSCLYGNMYISNIPSKSTYSFDLSNQKRVFENVPAPNRNGYEIFDLEKKSNENLTIFIKAHATLTNNKLVIKLSDELFNKIISDSTCANHNVFLFCKTPNGKYFVHASSLNITELSPAIKKVDSNMSCDNNHLINGHFLYT